MLTAFDMNTHSFYRILGGVIAILIPFMGLAQPSSQVRDKTQISAEDLSLEVIEEKLAPAQIAEGKTTSIELSDGTRYEIETYPDKEEMKKALGLELPEKIKKQLLERGETIEDVNPLEPYEKMEAESKEKFNKMRVVFLENAAKALHKTQFAMGAGSIIGDSFQFVKVKAMKIMGKDVDMSDNLPRTFKQRSEQGVQSLLKSINYKLYTQAPLLIDANEFGLSLSVGIVAEAGISKKGGGGAEEIGLSLAYNKSQKAFVFELFHNSEKFNNSKSFVSVLGIVAKLGTSIGVREGAKVIKGSSFYPPMIPGFSSNSSNYFVTGFSSSLGLPPAPLADMLTFSNDFERTPLVRITVSPLVKGFIRIQVGPLDNVVRVLVTRVVDSLSSITKVVQSYKRGSCGQVFAL